MRISGAIVLLLVLVACDGPQTPTGPPLVVYSSEDDPANLPELLNAFTAETGIPVATVLGRSQANTDVVIAKTGTAADVLITSNIADIWRAGDKGALRPVERETLEIVPAFLKDPDGFWVALQQRIAVIVVSTTIDDHLDGDFRALARPPYEGRLCLSSIKNSMNQALIAMLIEDYGLKPAERVVRGWIRNLAAPPFATEELLIAALESGVCEFGIISEASNTTGMATTGGAPIYFDVSAMGVGRHANSPARAQQLIAWLVANKLLADPPESTGHNIGIAGWRNRDVILLAERVGYR